MHAISTTTKKLRVLQYPLNPLSYPPVTIRKLFGGTVFLYLNQVYVSKCGQASLTYLSTNIWGNFTESFNYLVCLVSLYELYKLIVNPVDFCTR